MAAKSAKGRVGPLKGVRRGLTPRQEALALLGEGVTAAEAARRVGVHERTVRKWRDLEGSPLVIEEAAETRKAVFADSIEEARRILRAAAPDASRAIVGALGASKDADVIRAAATLLDRVGVPRTERVETIGGEVDYSHMTPEKRALLRELLAEAMGGGSPAE